MLTNNSLGSSLSSLELNPEIAYWELKQIRLGDIERTIIYQYFIHRESNNDLLK